MEEPAQKTTVACALAAVMVEVHIALFNNRVNAHRNQGKVSLPQVLLLMNLRRYGSIYMTEISRKMAYSTAAATGLVDRLEKLRYVKRIHVDGDRRKVFVEITGKGLDYLKSYEEMLVSCMVVTNEAEVRELMPLTRSVHVASAALTASTSGLESELSQAA